MPLSRTWNWMMMMQNSACPLLTGKFVNLFTCGGAKFCCICGGRGGKPPKPPGCCCCQGAFCNDCWTAVSFWFSTFERCWLITLKRKKHWNFYWFYVFTTDSWNISQGYPNNTRAQKWWVIASVPSKSKKNSTFFRHQLAKIFKTGTCKIWTQFPLQEEIS